MIALLEYYLLHDQILGITFDVAWQAGVVALLTTRNRQRGGKMPILYIGLLSLLVGYGGGTFGSLALGRLPGWVNDPSALTTSAVVILPMLFGFQDLYHRSLKIFPWLIVYNVLAGLSSLRVVVKLMDEAILSGYPTLWCILVGIVAGSGGSILLGIDLLVWQNPKLKPENLYGIKMAFIVAAMYYTKLYSLDKVTMACLIGCYYIVWSVITTAWKPGLDPFFFSAFQKKKLQ